MLKKQVAGTAAVCTATIIHQDAVKKTQQGMPQKDVSNDMADLFKIFGDNTRISILWALRISELCVCDVCAALNMQQSAISHQLRILKQARLVKYRREGKVVYYSLDDNHVHSIINQALEHVTEPLTSIGK